MSDGEAESLTRGRGSNLRSEQETRHFRSTAIRGSHQFGARSPEYSRVLERYLARLVQLKQIPEALAVLRARDRSQSGRSRPLRAPGGISGAEPAGRRAGGDLPASPGAVSRSLVVRQAGALLFALQERRRFRKAHAGSGQDFQRHRPRTIFCQRRLRRHAGALLAAEPVCEPALPAQPGFRAQSAERVSRLPHL